jgi:hypothetical protein
MVFSFAKGSKCNAAFYKSWFLVEVENSVHKKSLAIVTKKDEPLKRKRS